MTQYFRRDAAVQAAMCADELRAAGEDDGCAIWEQNTQAIDNCSQGRFARRHTQLAIPLTSGSSVIVA